MNRTMIASVAAALLGLSACGPVATDVAMDPGAGPSLAMSNTREPVEVVANSGCPGGEDVQMSGTLHNMISVSTDASGGVHVNGHLDWTGLRGTGLVTGRKYVGGQQNKLSLYAAPGVRSVAEIFHGWLIGQGDAPDARFQGLYHVTITPNGEVTSFVDSFTIEC